MENVLVKMRKNTKELDWDSLITPHCQRLEIISPSIETLPDKFKDLTQLISLTLVCPLLKELPKSLYSCKSLEILKIKNASMIEMEQQSELTKLKTLQLANLQLRSLPTWLSNNTSLENLDIHGNLLFDLPINFEKLQSLRRLNLDNNRFDSLPWELEKLSKLNHLSLDKNNFDQDEKERISKVFNYNF